MIAATLRDEIWSSGELFHVVWIGIGYCAEVPMGMPHGVLDKTWCDMPNDETYLWKKHRNWSETGCWKLCQPPMAGSVIIWQCSSLFGHLQHEFTFWLVNFQRNSMIPSAGVKFRSRRFLMCGGSLSSILIKMVFILLINHQYKESGEHLERQIYNRQGQDRSVSSWDAALAAFRWTSNCQSRPRINPLHINKKTPCM